MDLLLQWVGVNPVKPMQIIVTPQGGSTALTGGSIIDMQIATASGTVRQVRTVVDGQGRIVSQSETSTSGTLQINPTGTGLEYAAPGTLTNADGSPSSLPASAPVIRFPSDYNRETTQQAMNTNIGSMKNQLSNSQEIADPMLPEMTTFTDSFFKDTFVDLLAWDLPNHSSQCPAPSFDWNGSTYVMDVHCQLVQDHFSTFQAVMTVIYLIFALFIVLGA
jgi:hypothetical protein